VALTPAEVEALYGIYKVTVYKHGLVVERRARYPMKKHIPPKRKGIFEMTRKSRLKLTHLIANCEVKFTSMFTLTYGNFINPIDGRELKRQVNILLGHFRKRFPEHEYCWFLEFTTQKGRPHLHVVTTAMPNQFDRNWLGATWSKVSVYDAIRRLLENKGNGLRVVHPINMFDVLEECEKVWKVHKHIKCWEKIRKSDGAMRYALKYAAKQEQKLVPPQFGNVGRFWGNSRGVTAEPIGELLIGETMTEEAVRGILEQSVGQLPLIPRYIFQRDALEFFQSRGLHLTEIFEKFLPDILDQKPKTVV